MWMISILALLLITIFNSNALESTKAPLYAIHYLTNSSTVLVRVDPKTGNITITSQVLPSGIFSLDEFLRLDFFFSSFFVILFVNLMPINLRKIECIM